MNCFVDLDGVLVDFVGGAMRHFGKSIEHWPPGESNILNVLDTSAQAFWGQLDEAFWAELEPLEDASALMALLESKFGSLQICILSSPSRDPRSLSGKVKWIQRHLPKYTKRFLIGPPKEFCAHQGSVLIDDRVRCVSRFRAAGGAAILMPRLWNEGHAIGDPLGHVRDCIERKDWFDPPEEAVDDSESISFDFN